MKNVKKYLTNPIWLIKRIYEKYFAIKRYNQIHINSFQAFLKNITQSELDEYDQIVKEFTEFNEIHEYVNNAFKSANLKGNYPPDPYGWPSFLYYFIRKTKPKIIVETGCWYGNSSTMILSALHKNNEGMLYTIDLPAYKVTGGYTDENPYRKKEDRTGYLPEGKEPGFIVPKFFKDRWKLIYGKSYEKLPGLLNELGSIDMFLHDSLHSYENMTWEFKIAYKHLNQGGCIFSDNIDWNSAFNDFATNKKSFKYLAYYESYKLRLNFGAIKKE